MSGSPAQGVRLVPHDPEWSAEFARCRDVLLELFAGVNCRIEHVGSTSIAGIRAKPIVDIMLGVDALSVVEARIPDLEVADWHYVPEYEDEMPDRRYFRRPRTRPRTHHLHCEVLGSPGWQGRIVFRDRLRADPALAAEYDRLKARLAGGVGPDRTAYQDRKGPFIEAVIAGAPLP